MGLKMGKGVGSGEGWGEGEGNGGRGHHGHKKTKNDWNQGLCSSCGNCSVCCMTFWCPCVSMCLLADKAGLTGCQHKYLSFLDCFGSAVFFTWISACLTRERIRDEYNIPGDGCKDCVSTY